MKRLYFYLILCTCLIHHNSFAERCTEVLDSTLPTVLESTIEGIEFRDNCTKYEYMHYYFNNKESAAELRCSTCRRGYSLITLSHFLDDIDTGANCEDNDRHAVVCAKPCDSSCVDDPSWSNDTGAVEVFFARYCKYKNKVCVTEDYYRCLPNYFGTPTENEDNCISCSIATNNSNSKADAGAESITECYLPANKTLTDNSGKYTYTEDCYYSN